MRNLVAVILSAIRTPRGRERVEGRAYRTIPDGVDMHGDPRGV